MSNQNFFLDKIEFEKWIGYHQGNGIYNFLFNGDNPKTEVVNPNTGTATPTLRLGKMHKLKRISVYKSNATSVTFSVNYIPHKGDKNFPEVLYSNDTYTSQSFIFEADQKSYESKEADYVFNLDNSVSANYKILVCVELLENP